MKAEFVLKNDKLNRVGMGLVLVTLWSVSAAGANLYRTSADGTWADGNWQDSGSTPYTEPAATNDAYIGTDDDAVAAAAAAVMIDAAGAVASNLFVASPAASGAGVNGALHISNAASLTVHGNLMVGDPHAATSFTMASNATLVVEGDARTDTGTTATWDGDVTVHGEIQVGLTYNSGYGTLKLDGATAVVSNRVVLGAHTLTGGHLILTNGASLAIGTDLQVGLRYNTFGGSITIADDCRLSIADGFTIEDDVDGITIDNPNTNKLWIGGLLWVGGYRAGTVTFTQNGGVLEAASFRLGDNLGTAGIYNLNDGGTLRLRRPAAGTTVCLLGESDGGVRWAGYHDAFYLGDADNPGTIDMRDTGSGDIDLTIRNRASIEKSTLTGWGEVSLNGELRNNGIVVADGFGSERDLVITNFSAVTQTIEDNTGEYGWFAVNGGRLTLPALTNLSAHATVRWGDTIGDVTSVLSNDLVNSVMLDFANCNGGAVSISLLSTNRSDAVVASTNVIGVWAIDADAFDFGGGSATLTFRYDALRAQGAGLAEGDLKLWKYDGKWEEVTDALDTTHAKITSLPQSSFARYAVSTDIPTFFPPPGTVISIR